MLAPKIENKTQNARTCEIKPKKCEKRKHRNPCQKPSTLAHFLFSLGKKRFVAKKNSQQEKLCDPCQKESFFQEGNFSCKVKTPSCFCPTQEMHATCMHKQVQWVTKSI
jgi:hypothetical protein